MNVDELVRHQQAVLTGLLAAHGADMPPRISCRISEAADELLDPLVLPELLPAQDLLARQPKDVLDGAIAALHDAIARADARTALACGRALRNLHVAADMWPNP